MTEWTKETGDFDFFNGHFDVAHRRLLKPLTGSDEWEQYAGTCSARTHFDGAISIDEVQFPTKGAYGFSLRLFDPETKEWSIYWVSSTSYELFPPVRGKWEDGSCWLVGEDEHDGQPILVSYSWSDITETTAHWEQSYSVDGGETWELNWTMDFTRRETAPPRLDVPKVTGDFDFQVGSWDLHNRRRRPALGEPAEWYELESKLQAWTYFDGAISFDEAWFPSLGFRGATFRLYNPVSATWSIHWINSRRGKLEPPVIGSFTDGVGVFEGPDLWEDQPIDVRFLWNPGNDQSTWQQSFSPDGGVTWIPNWEMKHTRAD